MVVFIMWTRRYNTRCCGDCEKIRMKLSKNNMDNLH